MTCWAGSGSDNGAGKPVAVLLSADVQCPYAKGRQRRRSSKDAL